MTCPLCCNGQVQICVFVVSYILNDNMASSPENTSDDQSSTEVPTDQSGSGNNASSKSYAKSRSRVSKDNLYMIIALWMEDFPEDFVDDDPVHHRNVGAVLVLPNDVVVAADCSQGGVHAVARLLMKHYDKAKGCKMFMSRKPCPFCAKLLVQSKVERVLFLPRKPEYHLYDNEKNKKCMEQVDNMFTASPIAQIRFVLQIEEHVLDDPTKNLSNEEIQRLLTRDFSLEWIGGSIDIVKENLPWPAFDEGVKEEVEKYFDNAMKWMAGAIASSKTELNFERISGETESTFDPVNKNSDKKQADHFMTIARFLAQRTDDPKAGVGAVIVSPQNMEILAFGWNGFPFKALYGEFPRASDDDKPSTTGVKPEEKFSYVIHAEQNALLMRNEKNIKGATLFVTRTPCDECTPLIAMQGIKTVVVDEDVLARGDKEPKGALSYKKFLSMVRKGKFICFQTKKRQKASTGRDDVSADLFGAKGDDE